MHPRCRRQPLGTCLKSDSQKISRHLCDNAYMGTKTFIYIGIFIGSTVGSWLGAAMDHGNWLGGWSILLGGVGGLVGIWAGYKLGKNYS